MRRHLHRSARRPADARLPETLPRANPLQVDHRRVPSVDRQNFHRRLSNAALRLRRPHVHRLRLLRQELPRHG